MKLFFNISIRDHKNNIPDKLSLNVEFYNKDTKAWERIKYEELEYKEGTYQFMYNIPSRIYGDQLTLRKVREVLQAGGNPMFRVTDATELDQTHILSKQGEYTLMDDGISYDHKTIYLIDKESIKHYGDPEVPEILVASTVSPQDESAEIAELKSQIARLQEQLEQKQTSNSNGANTEDQQSQIDTLYKTINTLEDQVERLILEKDDLSNEINVHKETLSQRTAENEELQNKLIQKNQTLQELQAQVEETNLAIAERNAEIQTMTAEKTVLESTIAQQGESIKGNQQEISDYKTTEQQQKDTIASLESHLQTLQEQVDSKSEQESQEAYIPKSVAANKLYTDVIDELKVAKDKTATSGFKLSNISINLKAVAEKDEQGLRFQVIDIHNASTINGAAISDIKIDITEEDAPVNNELIVPKLIGLTETAARKYLEKYNLRLDPVYQLLNTKDSALAEGQAFKQSPDPGTVAPPDSTITVIFAKNNQYLN